MLPSVLSNQLKIGLCDYIETTFPMSNHAFKGTLTKMLSTKGAVFHEPYFAVRLPFRIATENSVQFSTIHSKYKPYMHQQKAFERLTGQDGRSTLIATGTGSGKTECFLYPILEYCYRHRGERGIKALIIYPMNALASDQAKRIAELIYESPELRGNVTAGMYVGGFEKQASRMMQKDKIITDHETMLSNPPDILLTNYKMLDYLLVRPKDAMLWESNNPDTLKYIAVDELHTFDGAQGTDLACLLRRLKARLYTQQGYLCCIGTSATMGDKGSALNIREYASSIFGEDFEEDSVITEDRLTVSEFFKGHEMKDFTFPTEEQCKELLYLINEDDQRAYLTYAAKSWLNNALDSNDIMSDKSRLNIGKQLMEHSFIQNMLELMGGNYTQQEYICRELEVKFPALLKLVNPHIAIDALFALISHGRIGEEGHLRPFLNVQVQLWMRELRRLLAKVSEDNIEYALAADLNENQIKHYLPIVNCRDCGETGWVGIQNERNNMTMVDLRTFYNLYFNQDSKVRMVYPQEGQNIPHKMFPARLCTQCLQLDIGENVNEGCSACGQKNIPVILPTDNIIGKGAYKQFICPFCKSRHGLSLMGLRSATAISAEISQLYSSKFNDDKKLLAFSDNVQDAAHRAGFFNSRTWKFSLRTAIQHFALETGGNLSLADFQSTFIEYWHDKLTDEEFISLFIAPNMTWMRTYEKMKSSGILEQTSETKFFIESIEQRIKYEIMLEFGLSSHIGRTLKKSSCSILRFNTEELIKIAEIVKTRTVNELGALENNSIETFERMVVGFLHIMCSNGAFNDSAYNIFTGNEAKTYLLSNSKTKWMPGTHAGRNIPRFICELKAKGKKLWGFDEIIGNSKYINWVDDCIDQIMRREDLSENIANIILEELIKSGIIVTMPSPVNYAAYAIDKSTVYISTNVDQFVCDTCGITVSISEENSGLWIETPCVRYQCSGKLYASEEKGLNYYGRLYSNGNINRVFAREHTGLLERDDREELERVFQRKEDKKKPWDTNLLSCTPTLEMGIDIGDLSTVILCSMPPGQAQFLQRTGRAGRKDGNSLTIVVANARPHDLYFYAEPMEMIQGTVEPPKIFLRASAVLERQFVAYCMDSWIKRGVAEKAIPKKIGVCLNKLSERPQDIYPFNFLSFVQSNLTSLIRTFIQLFSRADDGLDESSICDIERFAKGNQLEDSPMHMKILEAFEALKSQKEILLKNVKQLKELIKVFEDKPKDSSYEEEIKDLKSELYAISNVVRNLNNKDVFNFLSEEGLLPNYAFPEAGIVLKAVLFRKEEAPNGQEEEKKRKYENMVFEYNRSASSALSEFAPNNSFYADGKRLEINQIDMTTAQRAKWRLCPNCSHGEKNSHVTNMAACPRCGSPAWADAGQIRTMLKAKMVYSNMPYQKAHISDESDDRSIIFYCKQLMVDVDEDKDILKAYRMDNDDFPFGYEFVKKATLREINFGERDMEGEKLTVSGVEDVRKGFKICKFCGHIQTKSGKANHSFTCKAKNPQPGDNEPYEECLFLYREFTTEALRILVPSTTFDFSKTRQESFIAAFMLGMKEYFGNVDHLRATLSEVPVNDSDYRKQYLVIYDSVPGGTGYLKQLMQYENALIEILEKALNVLENCTCKDDLQKDGCYHCLYAYRQSQDIGEISRKIAIKILRQILSGQKNIEKIDMLGKIPVNSLFESELERRFIQVFEHMNNENRPVNIEKALINFKEGYSLKVKDCAWEVEPQVLLDEGYGVSVKSRADFVIWPRRESEGQRPIAVYTDGFLFHKDRAANDTLQREAIRRSGKFRVWTFSWKDVQDVFKRQGDYATQTFLPENMPSASIMYKPTIENGNVKDLQPNKSSTIELLMQYLQNPKAENVFKVHARAISLSLLDVRKSGDSIAFSDWYEEIKVISEQVQKLDSEFVINKSFFGTWTPRPTNASIKIFSGINTEEMKNKKENALPIVYALLSDSKDGRVDKYEQDWNGFWQFYNLMQFSDNFVGLTSTGIDQLIYYTLPINNNQVYDNNITRDDEWFIIRQELFDDEAIEFANQLISSDVKAPSCVGYELTDEKGAIVAECEMAWETEKVAGLLLDQIENKHIFKSYGWHIFILENEIPKEIRGGEVNE